MIFKFNYHSRIAEKRVKLDDAQTAYSWAAAEYEIRAKERFKLIELSRRCNGKAEEKQSDEVNATLNRALDELDVEWELIDTQMQKLIGLKEKYQKEFSQAVRGSLSNAPGHLLLVAAEFASTRRVFDQIVLPIIQEMREEYFEALSQNRIWKARLVHVRGTWSFFAALGLDRLFSIVSLCVKVWKSVN